MIGSISHFLSYFLRHRNKYLARGYKYVGFCMHDASEYDSFKYNPLHMVRKMHNIVKINPDTYF